MFATHGQDLSEQRRQGAILKERTRMARDIHDTLAQGFTGVIVQMEAAEEALLEEDPEHAVRHVRRARDIARGSLGEARRSVHALRPQALDKAGFADALRNVIQNTTAGTSLRTDFHLDGERRHLPANVEECLLRIGQEALSNALKHAGNLRRDGQDRNTAAMGIIKSIDEMQVTWPTATRAYSHDDRSSALPPPRRRRQFLHAALEPT
jgi:signal transduction histidine kinase